MEQFLNIKGKRDFGYWDKKIGGRIPFTTNDELLELIRKYDSLMNCGVSISVYNGRAYLYLIPFDFDASDIRYALKDAVKTFNFFSRGNYLTYLIYSAYKGYHVHVFTKIKSYTKNQLRTVQNHIRKILS